jgi:uncharacterized protein (DUF58 family)
MSKKEILNEQQLLNTPLELIATQVVEGFITGMHKSPFYGFSVEFAEHRLYNTGESTRHIDWKLFGRTDRLFVKRYEEETNLRCQIIVDTSASMYFPKDSLSKIRFSIYAAASIIHMLRKQRDASGLSLISDDISFHVSPKLQNAHHKLVMQQLEKLLLSQEGQIAKSNLSSSLHKLSELIHRRSLVIIFSDMFDTLDDKGKLFDALQHLKFNKHEVILFHVIDSGRELAFDYSNRPYLFTDSESGEKIKIIPSQIKVEYQKRIQAYIHEIKIKCAQYKIDFFEAQVGTDFSSVLTQFLIKRSKLY